MNYRLEINGTKMPPFLAAKNLKPLITKELVERTKFIEYMDGTIPKRGYEASILPEMCELYLKARRK